MKARAYKDRSVRENALRTLRNYLKLFGIILHSQGFTQTVIRFLFCAVFFLVEIITVAITVAVSSSPIVLLVEIEIKEFK